MMPEQANDNAVTLGEVARSLEMMRGDISGLRDVVVKRDDLTAAASSWQMLLTAHEQFSSQRYAALEARVVTLEAWQAWAVRIIVGAVAAAVLALVLVKPA